MEIKKYYLNEFQYFDGVNEIIMNIVDIDLERKFIKIAETNQGKITIKEYELKRDNKYRLYFEYGLLRDKIDVDEFQHIKEEY